MHGTLSIGFKGENGTIYLLEKDKAGHVVHTPESPKHRGSQYKGAPRFSAKKQGAGCATKCHFQEELLREDSKMQGHIQVGCLLYKKSGVRPPVDASPCYWLRRTPYITLSL